MILDLQKYNKIIQDGKEVTLIQQGTSRVYIDLNEIVEFTDPVIKEMCIKLINDTGHEVYLKDEIRQAELSYIIDSIDDIYVFANENKWSEVRSLRDLRHFPNLQELIIDEEGLFDHINEIDLKHIFVIGGYAFTNHPGIKFYGEDNLMGIGEGCLENATILNDKFNAIGLTDDDIEEGVFRNVTMNDIVLTNVSNIPAYFFEGATFNVLHIGDNCETINEYAFYKSDFNYIANALAITYIGYSAFEESKTHMIVDFPDLQEVDFYAFKNCVNIKEVRNLGSVWEISEQLFRGCISLCRINFGEIITTIRQEAFQGCHSLKTINLPETVSTVETHAFKNCDELAVVESMGSIGSFTEAIFENCKSLLRVHFPNHIDNYKVKAFVNCPKLRVLSNIYNYDGLDECFENCPNIDTVWLGKDMTEIETDKLNTNKFIKIIRFNEKLEYIQDEALSDLPNLHTIDVSTYRMRRSYMNALENINHDISIWNAFLMDSSINTSNLATTIKTLHTYDISIGALNNDNSTVSIPLQSYLLTVENVYLNAQEPVIFNSDLLQNWKPKVVYIGNNITGIYTTGHINSKLEKCYIGPDVSIIQSAFMAISTLTEINFENATSLKRIELMSICANSNIETLYLPPNLEIIYGGSINGNSNLSKIVFYDGFEHLSATSFGGNSGNIVHAHIKFPKSMRCVSSGCLGGPGYDTIEFHKDSSITFHEAFGSIASLNNLIFPDKMEVSNSWLSLSTTAGIINKVNVINIYNYNANASIGYAFPTVEKLEIGEYMTDMPNNFALNCTSLNTVTIKSEHITSIPNGAFYNCSSLYALDTSSTITYVGNYAFYNCSELLNFNFDDVSYIGNHAFYENNLLCTDLINDKIEYIGDRAFLSAKNIYNIDLPNIKTIGTAAFYNAAVQNVSIGDNIEYLPGNIFESSKKTFSSFYGPNIKTIGTAAFKNSTILNVSVSPECKNIEEYAFHGCPNLSSITDINGNNIFNIAEYIGQSAFENLYNHFITSFIIDSANIKIIDSSAFANTYIENISITNTPLTRIENAAFYTNSIEKSVKLEGLPLEYIGDYAFYNTRQAELELHNMPLKTIGNSAFRNASIKKINLHNMPLQTLGDNSFLSTLANNFYVNDTSLIKIGNGALFKCSLNIFDISNSYGDTGLVLDNSIFSTVTSHQSNNYLHTINLRNSGVSSINSSTFWWGFDNTYKNSPIEIDLRGLKYDCVLEPYAFTTSIRPTTKSSLDASIYIDEESHIVEIKNNAFRNLRLRFEKDIYDPETGVLDLAKFKYLKKYSILNTLYSNGNNYADNTDIRFNFEGINKLILGESIEEITDFISDNDSEIRKYDFSKTKVTTLSEYMYGVDEIILPHALERIEKRWLGYNTGNIKILDFPETVNYIGYYALEDQQVEILIFRNPKPATINFENANRMSTRIGHMPQLKEIYVPDSAVENYKNNVIWGFQYSISSDPEVEGNRSFKDIIYPLSAYYEKYGEEGWKPGMEV